MRNFLFLTTANLATNPRLVKEVKLALEMSGKVSVIMFKLGNWSDAKSDIIANELKKRGTLSFSYCNATRSAYLPWFFWGVAEKLARLIYTFMPGSVLINALASSKRSFQLLWNYNIIKPKPDLICAHNLGALYPAWRLSEKWKTPFAFDVEDYHPGEFIRFDVVHEKKRREFLMKKLLPKAAAITSASPLISEYTMKLIGGHPAHHVILNSFSQKEFKKPTNQPIIESTSQLNLVWFSQKISFGRGLEQLFEALNLMVKGHSSMIESFNLIIIGDLDSDFESKVLAPLKDDMIGKCIHFLPPMKQEELHWSLAFYDVGLALEFDTADLNRQLCLTNKILAYAQAGLYILATDTPAQIEFIRNHPNSGIVCEQSATAMKDALLAIIHGRKLIIENRLERYKSVNELAWETERLHYSKLINNILSR